MNRLNLVIVLLTTMLCFGCQSRSVTGIMAPDGERPVEAIPKGEDPVTPTPSPTELPVCAPLASPWQAVNLDPPAEATGDCPVTQRSRKIGAELSTNYIVTYERKGDELVGASYYPKSNQTAVDRYRFDSAGRVIYMQRRNSDAIPYSRAYDDDGNLILDDSGYQTVTQRFSNGKLVERIVNTEGGRKVVSQWTYDQAGRLILAEAKRTGDYPATERADWKYDASGRPVEVIRRVNGVVSWINRWTFGSDNKLIKRVVISILGESGTGQLLDSYQGRRIEGIEGIVYWTAPGTVSENCRFPGAGATDGYAGAQYDLGWTRLAEAEPAPNLHRWQAEYAYHQLYDFGYYYYAPEPKWSTYNLLSGLWRPGLAGGGAVVEIDYDAEGRMTREQIYSVLPELTKGELLHSRSRRFENGQLLNDQSDVGPRDDAAAVQRSLQFRYDGQGHLTRRELWENGVVVAVHTWTFDQAGRHTRHAVELPYVVGDFWRGDGPLPSGFALKEHGTIARTFDASGRLIQSWEILHDGQRVDDWNYAYGDTGFVQWASRTDSDGLAQTLYQFDAQGRQILQWRESNGVRSTSTEEVYGASEMLESVTSYAYSENGEKTVTALTGYRYTCQ